MKKYNYLTSAILIFVGIMMIYLTKDFPFEGLQDVGGGFFPKLIGGLLIVLSVLVIVDTAVKPEGELTIDFKDPGMQKVLIMCGIMVVYCVVMKLAGFMIATAFMVAACSYLMGERKPVKILGIIAGILVFIYVIFEMVLHSGLPRGMLFH